VATSGDTGGAVANGFLGVEGVNVIILYPKGKVSPIQELQLTTCGQNITALEVEGSFDDCQAIVKEAFVDSELNEQYNLTSANSINVARWLPQQLYYFFAWQQWVAKYQDAQGNYPPMNIVVPSGNFGNICAGMMAKASGLPLGHFIAACNANDVVTRYLATEKYEIHKAIATVSNAMDVTAENLPDFARSGMTATLTFLVEERENVPAIPTSALEYRKGKTFVRLPAKDGKSPESRPVKIGLSENSFTEVVSGLEAGEEVLIPQVVRKKEDKKNPFAMAPPTRSSRSQGAGSGRSGSR
jgi:hypothetical protein